jgi:signal transduction histidine kinase
MNKSEQTTPSRFVSLRVRLILVVAAVALIISLITTYLLNITQPAPTAAAQQMAALLITSTVAALFIAAFALIAGITNRLNRITRVATALTTGSVGVRTGMKGTDEIGALGAALDRYADHVEHKQDELRFTLRRQRREIAHLTGALEALPDGVVVQDAGGMVIFMNEPAKKLLGAVSRFDNPTYKNLTAALTDSLGVMTAPGLYALGDPRRLEVEGRMIQAQAAALKSLAGERVGTVISMRDISEDVRRERAREALLKQISREVGDPLEAKARLAAASAQHPAVSLAGASAINSFAREMSRHAVSLQKLIIEMRELTTSHETPLAPTQRSLPLETLVWAVANEWRQIAQAANIRLDVLVEQHGLYVLGDERRLRWALGNLADNALKYTPPGGAMTLEIKGEEGGMARLRVRDNGVGISDEDLPHIFTRFYRGTPTMAGDGGRVLRVPGAGQGLTVARQIIETHGGSIAVKSKVGVGTAVYISLPLTAPETLELPRVVSSVEMDGETHRIDVLENLKTL